MKRFILYIALVITSSFVVIDSNLAQEMQAAPGGGNIFLNAPPVPTAVVFCNYVTFTRAIPPKEYTYFWQSSENGTSRTNNDLTLTHLWRTLANVTRSANNNSATVYLRAFHNDSQTWSPASSSLYAEGINPNPPSVHGDEVCVSGQASLSASHKDAGVTFKWYDGNTLESSNSVFTPTVSQTTTYTVYSVKDGCESLVGTPATAKVSNGATPGAVTTEHSVIPLSSGGALLTYSGGTGEIITWQINPPGGDHWFEYGGSISTYDVQMQELGEWQFRTLVGDGICPNTTSDAVSITMVIPEITVSGEDIVFGSTGTELTQEVTITSNVDWKISGSLPSWIASVSKSEGKANIPTNLTIIAKPNSEREKNIESIDIESSGVIVESIKFIQGETPFIDSEQEYLILSSEEEETVYYFGSNSDWQVDSHPDWFENFGSVFFDDWAHYYTPHYFGITPKKNTTNKPRKGVIVLTRRNDNNNVILKELPVYQLCGQPNMYYQEMETSVNVTNPQAYINDIIQDHTIFTYNSTNTDTWDILKESDIDFSNPENVIEVYSDRSVNGAQEYNSGAGWTREHTWPQSRGDFNTNRGVGTDLHNLKPCDNSVNTARSNYWFDYGNYDYIDGSFNTGSKKGTNPNVWEPRDNVKGDVARILFYMATRYQGENGELDLELVDNFPDDDSKEPKMALLSTLVEWHNQDPVDDKERYRNDVIYSYQNNRNPFIDHPEFVEKIWGKPLSESVFISEYIEGSGYNKAIEIYNNSPLNISASKLYLKKLVNGGNTIKSLNLTGTIAPYSTYVVAHADACEAIKANADFVTATNDQVMDFNGNDPIILTTEGSEIDRIGASGGANFGEDQTILRASNIIGGYSVQSNPVNVYQWVFLEEDNFNHLGYHQTETGFTPPNVFISEYIEGSSYNKALEIYNGTDEVISLSDFAIQKQTNEAGSYKGFSLSGLLAPKETYCIVNYRAEQSYLNKADLVTSSDVMLFNGDDPIRFLYKGVVVDHILASNGSYTKNATICRNSNIITPNTTWDTDDWEKLASIDMEKLGYHIMDSDPIFSPTSTENYIVTQSPVFPTTEITDDMPMHKVITNIGYFDGLGRSMQEISVAASPTYKDIIQTIVYDDLGRRKFNLLPYTDNLNGSFDNDNVTIEDPTHESYTSSSQYQFYQDPAFAHFGTDNDVPYSETVFDGSPLNLVKKQGAPGVDWQPNSSTTNRLESEHVVSSDYIVDEGGNIPYFKIVANQLDLDEKYYVNELLISITKDENNNEIHTYTDSKGVELVKDVLDGSLSHRTFYVYDDFGLLRYVLSPEAEINFSSATSGTYTANTDWVKNLCYYYEYDTRKRLIKKQLPGAEPVLMVYDNRDRIVMSQDGVQYLSDEWHFTKYDELDRIIITGVFTIPTSNTNRDELRDSYQADFNSYYEFSEDNTVTFPGYSLINSFPQKAPYNGIDTDDLLAITYYDNYSYSGVIGFNADENIGLCNGSITTYETEVKGFITGTKTRVGSENNWTVETPYYDEYGRVIYSKRTVDFGDDADGNNVAGSEIISNKYKFSGELVQTKQIQTFNAEPTEVNNYMCYDHMGRLLNTQMDANGFREVIADLKYNELGQLITKEIGNGLQELNYSYNIRGWLTKINDMEDIGDDLYCQNLAYNNPIEGISNEKQYNGNISATTWIDGSNPYFKSYKYTYDALNRLIQADYFDSPSSADNTFGVHGIKYDLNGNIKELKRNGFNKSVGSYGAFGVIDDLVYNYSGNRLIGVRNEILRSESSIFKDGLEWDGSNASDEGTWEYKYDANGNMYSDKNKGITNIIYNHLNLPTQVSLGFNNVNYLYDAAGTKYKKTTSDGFATRYYFSNFEYDKNMNLEYMHIGEGRIRVSNGVYNFDYTLKDHLGNTRILFTDENNDGIAEKLQVSNYYPFGMRHNQDNTHKISDKTTQYLYNGKELQEDFNLDWLDYGARFYDAALGRWHNNDPLADLRSWVSPYNYGQNNPISRIDPNGMLDTRYEDEQRNVLLETNDGSDAIITVSDEDRKAFDAAVKMTKNTDDPVWNNTMKKSLLGFELSWKQESLLSSMNSNWSKRAAINYWKTGEGGVAFALKEALSQWTNPELVVGGLSVGLSGLRPKLKQFSGTKKAWSEGATSNSIYTRVEPKTGNALQNTIYDSNGKAIGQVDFKPHMNKTQPSGHGHIMTEPGNLSSGHNGDHIPNSQLPTDWNALPEGVVPMYPIEN